MKMYIERATFIHKGDTESIEFAVNDPDATGHLGSTELTPWYNGYLDNIAPHETYVINHAIASFLIWAAPNVSWKIVSRREIYDLYWEIEAKININGLDHVYKTQTGYLSLGDNLTSLKADLYLIIDRLHKFVAERMIGRNTKEPFDAMIPPIKDIAHETK